MILPGLPWRLFVLAKAEGTPGDRPGTGQRFKRLCSRRLMWSRGEWSAGRSIHAGHRPQPFQDLRSSGYPGPLYEITTGPANSLLTLTLQRTGRKSCVT